MRRSSICLVGAVLLVWPCQVAVETRVVAELTVGPQSVTVVVRWGPPPARESGVSRERSRRRG